jgi:glycosyl-4,4'-diaponeurosporenoate acyltransferase
MFLSLPDHWIIILNVIGIPAAHLGLSWLFTRLPLAWFRPAAFPFRPLPGESCALYERRFGIRHWKELLPDAAPWFGGFEKKKLRAGDPDYLRTFRSETCRSEAAHHAQLLVLLGFVAWTPWPAALAIVLYAPLSNLPCILLQRHNRIRLTRVLARSA